MIRLILTLEYHKITSFETNETRIYVSLPYQGNLIHCYDITIEDEFYY